MLTPLWPLQMEKDSSRAKQQLHQSLWYLTDPQECVRDWTVRFIGEPRTRVPLWAAPVTPSSCPVPHPGYWWFLAAGAMLGNSRG